MKILVLTSGGDAPGMNSFLYHLQKSFKKDVYACRYGFKGLINGDIAPLSDFSVKTFKNQAGSVIKSSRCPEFASVRGFKKGLENAKNFDCVIILGGNGSYRGALQLSENGVRTIFVPATIDNDVDISMYSIGFHSAVKACCDYISSTMPSMEAFDRCAVFEVMGRHHEAIALNTAFAVDASYTILCEDDVDYDEIARVVKANYKERKSSIIVMREKIMPLSEFVEKLSEKCDKISIKGLIVGHVQRGTKPTKLEKSLAKAFAKEAVRCVKTGKKSYAIISKDGKISSFSAK